jgi:hypothetical protein
MTRPSGPLVRGRMSCAGAPAAPGGPGRGPAPGDGSGAAAGGGERRTVRGGADSPMSGAARRGRAMHVAVLRGSVERRRCRVAWSRGRSGEGAQADGERDEPEEHDGGGAGEAEADGGGAQRPGEGAHRGNGRRRGGAGGRRWRGGRRWGGSRGLGIRGDGGRLVSARQSPLGPRARAGGVGSGGRSLGHDRSHDRAGPWGHRCLHGQGRHARAQALGAWYDVIRDRYLRELTEGGLRWAA